MWTLYEKYPLKFDTNYLTHTLSYNHMQVNIDLHNEQVYGREVKISNSTKGVS